MFLFLKRAFISKFSTKTLPDCCYRAFNIQNNPFLNLFRPYFDLPGYLVLKNDIAKNNSEYVHTFFANVSVFLYL